MRSWRLLLDGDAPGPWNMGVDEALLASAGRGGSPTLRLYGWRGSWLSLGYGQPDHPACSDACARAGVGVVRRPTGGRAVLHGADLTYALSAPEALLPAGLSASYELVAAALLAALRGLGIAVERSPGGRPSPAEGSFDCFAGPAADEICAAGRKLAGSAQRRAGGGVLQHGSIRLAPDPHAAQAAAGLTAGAATSLAELGFDGGRQVLEDALVPAFAGLLGACFERGRLEAAEVTRAAMRGGRPRIAPARIPGGPERGLSRVLPERR